MFKPHFLGSPDQRVVDSRISILSGMFKQIYMVGMAQLVSAPDCGSGGQGFESLYPPFVSKSSAHLGLSPSGKAQDFDSCIRWFESS